MRVSTTHDQGNARLISAFSWHSLLKCRDSLDTCRTKKDEDMFVRISKRNRISAFCGWAEDSVGFRIYTDSLDVDNVVVEKSPRLGSGCR